MNRDREGNKKERGRKDRESKEEQKDFINRLGRKERQKLRALKKGDHSIWFGFGMFGLVGWSFTIPLLIMLGIGIWIDSRTGGEISWTLTFLGGGVFLGALNAWLWLSRERKKIAEEREEEEEKDGS